jgi:8-oxo-dGTP pyrophosphatase MutT (NUDIX family)
MRWPRPSPGSPGVGEVAVFGLPGDADGHRIVLAVAGEVTDDQDLPRRLLRHCRTRLPSYMVPAVVRVLPALPHNSNGKVDEAALRALIGPCTDVPLNELLRRLPGRLARRAGAGGTFRGICQRTRRLPAAHVRSGAHHRVGVDPGRRIAPRCVVDPSPQTRPLAAARRPRRRRERRIEQAALREAQEESGMARFRRSNAMVRATTSCRSTSTCTRFRRAPAEPGTSDTGTCASCCVALPRPGPRAISEESNDLRWIPVDELGTRDRRRECPAVAAQGRETALVRPVRRILARRWCWSEAWRSILATMRTWKHPPDRRPNPATFVMS